MRPGKPKPARRRAGPAVLVVAVGAMLSGCGTGSDLPSTSSDAVHVPATTHSVVMKSLDFAPSTVHARVGQSVSWLNEDQAPHNVTYVSGPRFRSSPRRMRIGGRYSIRLTQAGTIHYVCTLHPWMQATIIVSGGS